MKTTQYVQWHKCLRNTYLKRGERYLQWCIWLRPAAFQCHQILENVHVSGENQETTSH